MPCIWDNIVTKQVLTTYSWFIFLIARLDSITSDKAFLKLLKCKLINQVNINSHWLRFIINSVQAWTFTRRLTLTKYSCETVKYSAIKSINLLLRTFTHYANGKTYWFPFIQYWKMHYVRLELCYLKKTQKKTIICLWDLPKVQNWKIHYIHIWLKK